MSDPSLDIASLGGHTMGTSWSVRIATRPGRDLHPLYAGIQARLDDVVAQMSTWEPGSDISRFNQAAAGHAQPLPDAELIAWVSQLLTALFPPPKPAEPPRLDADGAPIAAEGA